jgi:hypothetical protein
MDQIKLLLSNLGQVCIKKNQKSNHFGSGVARYPLVMKSETQI